MSANRVSGKEAPQDLQRTAASVQSLHGVSGPPQRGQAGRLARGCPWEKNFMGDCLGIPGLRFCAAGRRLVVNCREKG